MTQTHECRQCTCCGMCRCFDYQGSNGKCRHCADYDTWAAHAQADLATYQQAENMDGWYTQSPKALKVHLVGCPSYKSDIRYVTSALVRGCQHKPIPDPHDNSIPGPVRVDQLAPGTRCRVCVPDVALPPAQSEARIWWRKSGTGWPDAPRKSLTDVLGPSSYRPVAP